MHKVGPERGGRPDNARLVFEPGNQWGRETEVAPFYVVPSWWRRFIYRVLTAREFTVYTYVVGMTDKYAISYPTVRQVQLDLGLGSRSIVSRAIGSLIKKGFLLMRPRLVRGIEVKRRPVYQRPHPAFTLLRLVELGLVDAELYPTNSVRDDDEIDRNGTAVARGLQSLLGAALFGAYEKTSADRKLEMLTGLLQHRLDTVIQAARSSGPISEDLPPGISALVAEDQGIPF